jgi:hypothetical protein
MHQGWTHVRAVCFMHYVLLHENLHRERERLEWSEGGGAHARVKRGI